MPVGASTRTRRQELLVSCVPACHSSCSHVFMLKSVPAYSCPCLHLVVLKTVLTRAHSYLHTFLAYPCLCTFLLVHTPTVVIYCPQTLLSASVPAHSCLSSLVILLAHILASAHSGSLAFLIREFLLSHIPADAIHTLVHSCSRRFLAAQVPARAIPSSHALLLAYVLVCTSLFTSDSVRAQSWSCRFLRLCIHPRECY